MSKQPTPASARKRFLISAAVGIIVLITTISLGAGKYAALTAWDSAALVFVSWTFLSLFTYDARQTRSHALSENPGRALSDTVLTVASLISLAAVAVLVLQTHNSYGVEKIFDAVLAPFSVVVSWMTIHTIWFLNYARLYYGEPAGGIDFNQRNAPQYSDFAYLAFTIGMTFQVSDTELQSSTLRAAALKHALLSYMFGTVIIATTINTVVSLSS